ncbi:MAG: penicillin-binding protein [Bacteroidetes bacterium]|nr:penicillin-binding protein [Bacteroidota bacterium]
MNKEHDGYVVYYKENDKELPFGVVSDDYECKANTDYIPSRLKEYLVQIEDRRFFGHCGIDVRGIARAAFSNIKAGKIVQGGSTITQQLARNIIKDNRRSISRKLKEAIKALELESSYSKDEILNLYFNNVYFGKNLRGIRTAGLHYFGKEVDNLTHTELLYLLTILRGPNYYINRPEKSISRFLNLSKMLCDAKIISQNRHIKDKRTKFVLQDNLFQTIKRQTIPFIIQLENSKHKRILSTIDIKIQNFAKQFVDESKYPVSIVAIQNRKVVAFASSYGTDYPFISKSNVGSTLKPFLYCYLRESGILLTEKFSAFKNDLNWNVREVTYYNSFLNISEALFCSNNNVFLNASSKVGIDGSLQYLADVLNLNSNDFYLSSILGATKKGISLYELAYAYSIFFDIKNLTETKRECLSILNRIFKNKLGFTIENVFLKTGTTNDNKERYAVLGNSDITFAVLRNENTINDESKEGSFMKYIARQFLSYLNPKNDYKWI